MNSSLSSQTHGQVRPSDSRPDDQIRAHGLAGNMTDKKQQQNRLSITTNILSFTSADQFPESLLRDCEPGVQTFERTDVR